MDFIKQYSARTLGVIALSVFVLGVATIQAFGGFQVLIAGISNLVGGQSAQVASAGCILTRDLQEGEQGDDVRILQKFLNRKYYTVSLSGNGTPGQEYPIFDSNTKEALALYQSDTDISPANGILGSTTRSIINTRLSAIDCGPNSGIPFYFDEILGQADAYEAGGNIALTAKAIERIDSSIATNSEGFNVQAYIYKVDGDRTQSLSKTYLPPNPAGSYNASFNTLTSLWGVNMIVPTTTGSYLLKVAVNCSKKRSYCEDVYDRGNDVTVVIPFRVGGDVEELPPMIVDLISTDATVETSEIGGDIGTFNIKYRVEALENIILTRPCGEDVIGGIRFEILSSDSNIDYNSACAVSYNTNPGSSDIIYLDEGESIDITLTVDVFSLSKLGLFALKMKGFDWGKASGEYTYLFEVPSTFKTKYISLKAPTGSNIELISPNSGTFSTLSVPIPIRWTVGSTVSKISLIYAGSYEDSPVRYPIGEEIGIRLFSPSGNNSGSYDFYVPDNIFDGKWYVQLLEFGTNSSVKSTSTINISSKG